MNKIIEDYKKIVAGNEAGKNICFMSRGEYADPKIAYNGILMNYWDVYDCMDEVEEPTDDDWLNAVSNLFDSYTYDVKNTDVDKFKMSDVMNVYRIINLQLYNKKNIDMNNSMVAHLWANEKKESGKGSNLFFEGRSIYSYGYHFEVGRIVRNKCGEKAYLLNDKYYSSSTCKHQRCVRSAIPTGSKVFSVGYNMSDDGSMAFITSRLELIKEVIEKYKKVRTSLSYRDVWGVFRSLMDYIEFFNMGTPKSLLKKSANTWIGTKHELSYESDKIKSEYVHELKRVFEVLLNHQALETLGTTNVIVDEICGEGTWAEYVARCQRWEDSQAKKEALIFEKRRKEKEDRKKKFEEQIEMWKSGKILELYLHYYLEDDQPNVWLRIKNGIIETSKNIKIERAEAERLWKLIKLFHNGSKFQRDMVLDTTGHKWKINSYKNDILVAGCHRIAYSEMEGVARQLGWD